MKQVAKKIFSLGCISVMLASCSQMADIGSTPGEEARIERKNKSLVKKGLPELPSKSVVARAAKLKKQDKHGAKTYRDKERVRLVRTTSYSHMEKEPGAPGRKNCLGGILKYGKVRSVAADWSVYPVGTKFRIKGLPHIFVVDDYGSALVGTNTVDIFHPSLRLMRNWGTRNVELTIIQWGDYERSLRMLSKRTKYRHCRAMHDKLVKRMTRGRVAKVETTPVM